MLFHCVTLPSAAAVVLVVPRTPRERDWCRQHPTPRRTGPPGARAALHSTRGSR
jgi:hypothetical protein